MAKVSTGLGIDFGTTNSIMALYEGGMTRPLMDGHGRPHPSVVWYQPDGKITVGRQAKRNIHGYSDQPGHHFVSSIKRSLGKNRSYRVFGQTRTPGDIASDIFGFLLAHAREDEGIRERRFQLGEAVVTIPVYFDGPARRELRKAADRAGLYVKTFVHEPFAAVVSYCIGRDGRGGLESLEGRNLLVFDWGGGTLDITLAGIRNGIMTELATSGLEDRAGDHFDESLSKATRSRFLDRERINLSDLEQAPGVKDRFLAECERAKIALSKEASDKVQVAKAFKASGAIYDLDERISRSDFESLIRFDVRDAMAEVDKSLEKAVLTAGQVDHALLIGGSSNIPMVRAELETRFGARLEVVKNADTIIAEGAAIVDALGMLPVLAQSIGVRLSDGSDYEIFPAGTVAKPGVCKRTVNFFCTDNRNGDARLVITEKNPKESWKVKELLSIPVSPDLPEPYNHERVTVDFFLDDDLVLNIVGKGATRTAGNNTEIFDLRYGMETHGG
jgi:molecular chaperone DnaK (HSP70)